MKKIQRVSKFFKWIFQLAFVLAPILLILFWIKFPSPVSNLAAEHGFFIRFISKGINIMHPISTTTKLLGFIIDLIPSTVNLCIFYFLIHLFKLFEKANIFSMDNVIYIKRIGYAILIGQLINPVYQLLISANLTWHNPPGHRMMSISLSGTNIGLILTALLIILISWIMAEGYKLKEEQEYTI